MMNHLRLDRARRPTALSLALAAALAAAGFAQGALAQDTAKKASSPFQGFSADNGQPVDVKSDSLEVHQTEQRAVFVGNVVATQGESVLHSDKLIVFYDNAEVGAAGTAKAPDAAAATPAAAPAAAPAGGPGQASAIKRLEATGNVVVTSTDQKATGSTGVFDMASDTATLTGDVVLTQGLNVVRGKQLVVDMKTGIAKVLGGTSALFVPNKDQGKPAAGAPKAK
jgi:lipopolysaccharide export system protein LptA